MCKAIIWDLDGTLLDTTSGVIYAVKYTIKELGLVMPSEEILRTFPGPPMQLSFKKYYSMGEKEALKAANRFRFNYKNHSLLKAELYPNILEILSYLKQNGYKMAVATNKSHENAMEILKHFKISDYCDYMLGSDLEGKLTKADIIKKCIKMLGVSANEAVYIGDSIFDLEGAEKIGLNFIGVTYGFGFKKGEISKYKMIDRIIDLKEILRGVKC